MTRTAGARTRNAVAACLVLLVALGFPTDALGATITVTTEADSVLADGACSLREAVTAANTDSPLFAGAGECAAGNGADVVALPAGTFKLTKPGAGEDGNGTGDLDVLGTELTIVGAGAPATTIDGNGTDRVIDVRTGRIATIRSLVITGGRAPDGDDGGNRTGPSPGDSATGVAGDPGEPGGGIRNLGTLTVADTTISSNTAGSGGDGGTGTGGNGSVFPGFGTGGAGGTGGSGGGIYSAGVLTVVRSMITTNAAGPGGEGGTGQGGSAISSNGMGGLGTGGTGGLGGNGGGIASEDGAAATIEDSSIAANAAGAGGRGGFGQGGQGGPAGPMSGASGGQGGQGGGGLGGPGGSGGGLSGALTANRVLVQGNAAGAAGDGGNGAGNVGGPALGTGNGGHGGMGLGNNGGLAGAGGGIRSRAMTLVASTVTGNTSGAGGDGGNGNGGQGGGAVSGGGGNGGVGDGGSGNPSGNGGGVRTTDTSTIRQATISSNQIAAGGAAGAATGGTGGGGAPPGSAGVSAPGTPGSTGTGGGVSANAATTLAGAVVADNATPSCNGTVQDGQQNVTFPDAACPGLTADPMLGPLAENGGPTRTQAIGPGSPAFDLAPAGGASCSATDQRGVTRPFGPACDAGAYEWAPPTVATGAATMLSSTTAALTGTVNPNARGTSYHFELGTTTAYGRSTTLRTLDAGVAAVAADATVDGLVVGVTYHYRLVASNADGTTFGEDRTFVLGDTSAPRFLSASINPKVFAVNRRGRAERPVAAQRPRRGTTFRFRLSEAARVVFTISRAAPGRRVRGRCVRPTRRNRTRRRCTRYVRVRSFAMQARAGSNRKRFSGKIGRRSLRPSRYRATLVAIDAAGNRSAPRRLRFRVVRAR